MRSLGRNSTASREVEVGGFRDRSAARDADRQSVRGGCGPGTIPMRSGSSPESRNCAALWAFSALRSPRRSCFALRFSCLARSRCRFAWLAGPGLAMIRTPFFESRRFKVAPIPTLGTPGPVRPGAPARAWLGCVADTRTASRYHSTSVERSPLRIGCRRLAGSSIHSSGSDIRDCIASRRRARRSGTQNPLETHVL